MHSIRSLFTFNQVPRPAALLALVSFAMAFPMAIGVYTGQTGLGMTGTIGALMTLHAPGIQRRPRYPLLLLAIIPFCASFGLGLISQSHWLLSSLSLALVATTACIFNVTLRFPPPGSFFIIMICCLAKTHTVPVAQIPLTLAVFASGSLFAIMLVALHDALVERKGTLKASHIKPLYTPFSARIFLRSCVSGLAIGGSYALALQLGNENPYWVPITCAAILQGKRLTDFWLRSFQRILGTAVGVLVTWGLFMLEPTTWVLVGLLFVFSFIIEMIVPKNYALACVLITPMTVILAHTATESVATTLANARLQDVLIGSAAGLLAGLLLRQIPLQEND